MLGLKDRKPKGNEFSLQQSSLSDWDSQPSDATSATLAAAG